jgi:hypothetical protein
MSTACAQAPYSPEASPVSNSEYMACAIDGFADPSSPLLARNGNSLVNTPAIVVDDYTKRRSHSTLVELADRHLQASLSHAAFRTKRTQ